MKSLKPHIGIYGRCNAGKSTLLNFLIGETLAIVSHERGTTTDPVRRSFEILDFAPVVAIDTAGYDDVSPLGVERIAKTVDTLHHIDLAILLYNGEWGSEDEKFLELIKREGVEYLIVKNLYSESNDSHTNSIAIAMTHEDERNALIELIKSALPKHSYIQPSMLGDYLTVGDIVIMVCPIDSEAPAGRLILPQVQALRDALDNRAVAVVLQTEELAAFLSKGIVPKLIVTDSQVIDVVREVVGDELYSKVTTFSILLAQLKGDVALYNQGLLAVSNLVDGDKILIMESCLHQTSCEDIGRVKIPAWLDSWVGAKLNYTFLTGLTPLPEDIASYSLVVQCGGCMVTARQLKSRIYRVANIGVPITNYGMLIKMIR